MAVSGKWFSKGLVAILNKQVDIDSDALKVSLHTSTFTPNQDTMDYQNDLTNEVSESGTYATGGASLANVAVSYDADTNVIKIDADDVQWTGATITARYAVIYDSTPGSSATNPLLGYVDFGADVVSTAGPFTITWSADGILKLTVS